MERWNVTGHSLSERMRIGREVAMARPQTPWKTLETQFGRDRVTLWRYVAERQRLVARATSKPLTGHAMIDAASAGN